MKKILTIISAATLTLLTYSCEPDPCTTTIDTINGPQEIEIDCV